MKFRPRHVFLRSLLVVLLAAATGARASAPDHAAAAAAIADESPDNVGRSLLVLAQRMADRKDREAAETAYTELLNSAAGAELKQQGLLAYASFLKQTGRILRAAAVYEKYLSEYPDSALTPSVMISLGRALRDMGAYDQALVRFYAVLNSTLAVGNDRADDYRGLSQLAKFEIADTFYQRGDYASAGKYFGRIKLLDLPPEERARASFREAYAFYLDNQFELAVPALRAFLDRFPEDGATQEAHYLLCLALRKLNRMEDALNETLALLRTARERTGAEPERWAYWQRKTGNHLANDFFEQGDFTSALTIYQTLAQLRPEPSWRWPAVYQIGLCYERLRQTERAAAAYRSILDDAEKTMKAGTTPAPAEKEVRQMAQWRLGQLDWSSNVERTVRGYETPLRVGDSPGVATHP